MVCTETTGKINHTQKLAESKDALAFAIEAAELETWDYDLQTNCLKVNERLKEWIGLPTGDERTLSQGKLAIAEADQDRVTEAIGRALTYSSGGRFDMECSLVNSLTAQERFVSAIGKAWFHEDQIGYRFNGILQNITEQMKARRKVEASEEALKRFKFMADQARDPLILMREVSGCI